VNGWSLKHPIWQTDSSPGVLTKEIQNYVKWGREEVTWPTFEIMVPPPYLGNAWN